MLGHKFYHSTIRKYVILFGSLFNDIIIDRVDETGNAIQSLTVPLMYGPKDRYLVRLRENPDLLRQINLLLPRMSFEITGVNYDPDRKLSSVLTLSDVTDDGNTLQSMYAPVPYNFDIQLSVLSRNADDATRIVEQILPFFKPEWTTTVSLIPEISFTTDIPIVLNSVATQDTYEDSFVSRYAIIWTLNFTLKGYLFGPVSKQGVIKEIDVNFYVPSTNTAAEGVGITDKAEWITILPGLTANGQPTSNVALSVSSSLINANSNYGYITEFFSNMEST